MTPRSVRRWGGVPGGQGAPATPASRPENPQAGSKVTGTSLCPRCRSAERNTTGYCRPCARVINRAWNEKNRDRVRACRAARREKLLAQNRESYQRHREEYLLRRRQKRRAERAIREAARLGETVICAYCTRTVPNPTGRKRRFCSKACSDKCFPRKPLWTATCAECASAFETNREARRYCSASCRDAAHRRADNGRHRRERRGHPAYHQRRRVFDRDGWACYLCSRPIDRARRWPHPLSASIDHVVPLSAGGSHRPDNLRATHWGCNEAKGDALPGVEVWVPMEASA